MIITALVLTAVIPFLGIVAEAFNVLLVYILKKLVGSKFTNILCNYITFPGTVHHELSHALLAGAKIDHISLFKPDGESLGSVEYHNRGIFIFRAIQDSLSAIAPVLFGTLTSGLILFVLFKLNLPLPAIIVLIYLLVSIILHMRMSPADIKIMWKGIPIIFLIVLLVVYITKFDILVFLNL